MAYTTQNKAHSNHYITKPDGSTASRYSRYETGRITGRYREIPAVLADSTGFDSLGFDSSVGSVDDRWHVVNVFDSVNTYIDSIAVGGAMDSNHALQIAKSQLDSLGGTTCQLITNNAMQFDGMDHDHAWSIDAINKLMDNPAQNKSYLPVITAPELVVEAERVTFDSVQWDSNNNLISHGGKDSRLYLDLTRADTRNELVTEFDLADALFDMDAQEAGFDALMDTKSRLPLLKDRLFKALSKAGDESLSVTNVTQTKEFKRQGVINIAFVFDLSDGQKLSIWFHKPLESSSKLLPSDYMVSWKWMLNKRDVTAALSPKHGDNVQLPALARRIMRVAAKNSKRFKAAQARKAKVEQELLDAEQAIEDKKATISQLDADIADLNSKIDAALQERKDEAEKSPATTTETTTDENGVVKTIVRDANGAIISSSIDNTAATNRRDTQGGNGLSDDEVTKGSVNESTTVKGTKISSNFALVEAKKLIVSHDAAGVANPDFPQALQPRDRSDKKSVEAIKANAKKLQPEKLGQTDRVGNGAPIVGDDLIVESGNGRAMAVKLAYDNGDAENYRAWLIENADEFGFSAEQVEAYKQPVLVRVRTTAIDRIDFAIEANQDGYPQYFDNEESGDEAETTVSVYVNSRGRVLATVTKQAGKYNVKGENFSGGNYPDDESVLKQLKVVKENNPSMKLKEGKEFFSADDIGKSYPPVERGENGTYIAYMNSKKKDHWLAFPKANGGFTVYAENAQTRAYRFSTPKVFSNLEELLAAYPAFKGIDKLIAEDQASDDENDEIDSSEYPQMFLDRNKDKLNILGIGDDDIHVGLEDDYENKSEYSDLYHIDSGLFARQTLNFADAVCKTVDAAISLGADAVVGDFTATAYQDSMFDGLDSKSNPTYGITVQIEKGGVYLRADIDAYGECKILKGASGTDVITTIKHVFTDNTNEYQSALADALDIQVDDDMSTTDTHDAPKLSVGDKVVWRNDNGELHGTYRGETDGKVVLVVNGSQMEAPAGEVFADDQPESEKPAADQPKDDTLDDPDALFAAFFNEFYDEVMSSQRPKIQGLRLSANAVDGTNISFEAGNGKSYKILGSEYNPSGKNVNLNLIEVKANGAGYTSQNSMISIVASTKVTKNSDWMKSLRSKKEWLISEVFDVLDMDYQEKNKGKTAPVVEPATSAAAKRINEIEQQMSAADFDPMTIDTDELINLVDQVEGDADLSAKLDDLSTTLQQKIVAVSMKALTDMAGA
ncbi:hypothetical protein ACTXJO_04710 [Psychrobacter celer]|uniref:defense against restriction DarA-related protein n=1 Tax=Psychrobacter celer TaxID=306572 RepID=UPI003FD17BF2